MTAGKKPILPVEETVFVMEPWETKNISNPKEMEEKELMTKKDENEFEPTSQ